MGIGTNFVEKNAKIDDFLAKLSIDEKKIVLKKLIKSNMKAFFDVIFEERKFLEEETGIDDAYLIEQTSSPNTSEKVWLDGEEIEPNLSGKVSKEAENAYYLDKKRSEKLGNDRFDGFLGYVSDKKYISNGNESGDLEDNSDKNSNKNSNKNEENSPNFDDVSGENDKEDDIEKYLNDSTINNLVRF